MSEQKHYKYGGHVTLNMAEFKKRMLEATFPQKDIKVKNVEFLVPVKVTYTSEGNEYKATGHIDFAKQEAYFDGFADNMKDAIFNFLKDANTLPEDDFSLSPDEVKELLDSAESRMAEQMKKGENNG